MAERSFYDILEVSNSASQDAIEAAYKRLAEKFDPASPVNAGNAAARLQYDALRQAYMTLGSADNRAQYDRKLALRNIVPVRAAEVLEPFWTLPKLIVLGVIVLGIGGFYFKHQKDQARLEAEKVIAVAKAKEAEENARAETEAQRVAMQMERDRERAERMDAMRQRRERDADLRQVQRDIRSHEISGRVYGAMDRAQAQNEDYRKRAEESRVKREEMQAAAAARHQLARDKAELCRIERERYGNAISC
jgi:curved DNA-binding protein CbpA